MSTRNIVKNIRSNSVGTNGKPKLPSPNQLDYGEIAVNYKEGYETLSLKNDGNKIVSLSVNSVEDVKVNETSVVANKTANITMNGDTIPVAGREYDVITYPSPFNENKNVGKILLDKKLSEALKILEKNISALVTEVLDNEETSAAAIRKLAESAGTVDGSGNIGYQQAAGIHYISDAGSVHNATVKLDSEIYGLDTRIGSAERNINDLQTTVSDLQGSIGQSSGIEWVDLGLPSRTLWAKCNLGAFTETENGDFYMWGSTTPDNNHACNWTNAPFNNGSGTFNSSYFDSFKSEWLDSSNNLKPEFDAAYKATNGIAHIPTDIEWQELINNTTGSSASISGVNGRKFTSKTDASKYIFIPITLLSCRIESAFTTYSNSRFWSSTFASSTTNAWVYDISTQGIGKTSDPLCNGLHIRPVKNA